MDGNRVNDLQQRLWAGMLRAIRDYRTGRVSLRGLVTELEGSIDVGEFADRNLLEEFYSRWGSLETWLALHGDDVGYDETKGDVDRMEEFVLRRQP